MTVTLTTRDGHQLIQARQITRCFAVHRPYDRADLRCWSITHVPTGLRVCSVPTLSAARAVVHALTSRFTGWDATNPEALRKAKRFAGAKALITKHGGWI